MKSFKGLFATILVFTLIIGCISWIQLNNKDREESIFISGDCTTLEDPNPRRD